MTDSPLESLLAVCNADDVKGMVKEAEGVHVDEAIMNYIVDIANARVKNSVATFVIPLPNGLHKGFAAEVVAGFMFFFRKFLFNDVLGGNTAVVRTRHPVGIFPKHTVGTD